MKIGELRKAAKYWQEKLNLTEWRIVVRFAKEEEMAGDEYAGHAYWVPEYPEATILLRRGEGEHTLLHEMLHVRLEGAGLNPRKYNIGYERGINVLVEVLLGKPEP